MSLLASLVLFDRESLHQRDLQVIGSNPIPATNTKANSTAYAKPRLALASGAFACVRTVSVFGAIQKHERAA